MVSETMNADYKRIKFPGSSRGEKKAGEMLDASSLTQCLGKMK